MRFEQPQANAAGVPAAVAAQAANTRIVTFLVDGRVFATALGSVREIRGWQPATALPDSAPHVLGVLNLRGSIIVVYDLRRRLGLPERAPEASSVIIVVDLGEKTAGIVADSVSDILDISPGEMREAPDVAGDGADELIEALIVKGEAVITLLNLAAVARD
jgi:purine-binding chemotaxis protein CheW